MSSHQENLNDSEAVAQLLTKAISERQPTVKLRTLLPQDECKRILLAEPPSSPFKTFLFAALSYYQEDSEELTKVAQLLIQLQPELVEKQDNQELPVHVAIRNRTVSSHVVSLLLPREPPGDGLQVPLLHYALANTASLETVKVLIEHSDVGGSPVDGFGNNALHMACTCSNVTTLEVLQVLLIKYPDAVGQQDCQGRVPLHVALTCAPAEWLLEILRHTPIETATITHHGVSMFHYACQNCKSLEVIERLVNLTERQYPDQDVFRTSKDENGNTPLHSACMQRSPSVIAYILQCDPTAAKVCNDRGCLPLLLACQNCAADVEDAMFRVRKQLAEAYPEAIRTSATTSRFSMFKDRQTPINMLISASRKEPRNEELVRYLLKLCPDAIRSCDGHGRTPLHAACQMSGVSESLIKFLLDVDPRSAAESAGHNGATPFLLACGAHPLSTLQLLLEAHPAATKVSPRETAATNPLFKWCNAFPRRFAVEEALFISRMWPAWTIVPVYCAGRFRFPVTLLKQAKDERYDALAARVTVQMNDAAHALIAALLHPSTTVPAEVEQVLKANLKEYEETKGSDATAKTPQEQVTAVMRHLVREEETLQSFLLKEPVRKLVQDPLWQALTRVFIELKEHQGARLPCHELALIADDSSCSWVYLKECCMSLLSRKPTKSNG